MHNVSNALKRRVNTEQIKTFYCQQYNDNSGINFVRHSKYYTKLLTATELQVLVIVRVTVNNPLVQATLV